MRLRPKVQSSSSCTLLIQSSLCSIIRHGLLIRFRNINIPQVSKATFLHILAVLLATKEKQQMKVSSLGGLVAIVQSNMPVHIVCWKLYCWALHNNHMMEHQHPDMPQELVALLGRIKELQYAQVASCLFSRWQC